MKLGEILVKNHHIAPMDLEQAIARQGKSHRLLGEFLMHQGLIDDVQLKTALQEQYWRRQGFWVID